jgi:hypothetical protein
VAPWYSIRPSSLRIDRDRFWSRSRPVGRRWLNFGLCLHEVAPSPATSSDDPESSCWSLCLLLLSASRANRASRAISSSVSQTIFSTVFLGGGVDHPVPPCRLLGHNQSQTLVMTGRLDLLLLGNRPGCGWLYPLRDPNSLPPTSWTHVRVVPRLRDQLEPSLVGRGWCLT